MASILCVDDEPAVAVLLERVLRSMEHAPTIATSVAQALRIVDQGPCDLILTDYSMPGQSGLDLILQLGQRGLAIPVIIMTGFATVEHAVLAMRTGAVDYLTKPVRTESLRIAVGQALEVSRLKRENESYRLELSSLKGRRAILGDSEPVRAVLDAITTVAAAGATVLIEGESGTGKELFARALHELSPRAAGPFVSLNCAALPEGLVENALFGHEKGAFTGASARAQGAFERAHQGTLLLDEIAEMRLDLQAKLLRVLQELEFERIGGSDPVRVDVRVVATTNRPLHEEVAAGRFREDLFYRLNVVPIRAPPLRERLDDLPLLAKHFVQLAATQAGVPEPALSPAALKTLQAYAWPGNVRELAHSVERAVLFAGNRGRLEPEDFASIAAETPVPTSSGRLGGFPPSLPVNLRAVERMAINRALEQTHGNRRRAAELLGISDRTLRKKLNQ